MTICNYMGLKDGEVFRCGKSKSTKLIGISSFFFKCKTDTSDSVRITYLWSNSIQGMIGNNMLPNVPKATIYDFYNFCRDTTVRKYKGNHAIFDLDSETTAEIQIDESILGKKCKYNKGKPCKRRWVFGWTSSHKYHL